MQELVVVPQRALVQVREPVLEQVREPVVLEEQSRHRNQERRSLESSCYYASIRRWNFSTRRRNCSSSFGFPVLLQLWRALQQRRRLLPDSIFS